MPQSKDHTTSVGTATGSGEYDLVEVAAAMRSLAERVAAHGSSGSALQTLVEIAVERVPGARWASVSMMRAGRFTTSASTDQRALRADELQYELGVGPCVDAVLQDSVYVSGDVASEPRWNQWGQRASADVGINSALSQRLHLHDHREVLAGMNLYSDARDAFDRTAVGVGLILATHGAAVMGGLLSTHRATNLAKALHSNREIGTAMGILMNQHRFTRQEAFDVLSVASQNSNRRLADLAVDVVDTGTLTIRDDR